jgi:hypothetical protein
MAKSETGPWAERLVQQWTIGLRSSLADPVLLWDHAQDGTNSDYFDEISCPFFLVRRLRKPNVDGHIQI